MAQVTITVRKNGSLRVDDPNGVLELVDADGNKYDLAGKTALASAVAALPPTGPSATALTIKLAFRRPIPRSRPGRAGSC
jgi:hypothetical protein